MSRTGFFKKALLLLAVLSPFIVEASYAASKGIEGITDPAEGWNELWGELMADITVIGIIFAAMTLYLLVRYRRRRPGESGKGRELKPLAAFGWVIIPIFVFMADDMYLAAENFEHWSVLRTVPKNALVIEAEGYMWGWDFKYPNGIKTNNEIRVPQGRPVHIKLTSRDAVHSLFIPDYKIKWDAVPGKENYLWFYPKEAGEHVLTCTEFCGALHSSMYGKVIVLPEADYDKWVEENRVKGGEV